MQESPALQNRNCLSVYLSVYAEYTLYTLEQCTYIQTRMTRKTEIKKIEITHDF